MLPPTLPTAGTGPAPAAAPARGGLKWLRRSLLVLLLWVLAAEWALLFTVEGLPLSFIWPANGIAVGAVLAYGLRIVPPLVLGVVLWHVWHGWFEANVLESLLGLAALALALWLAWWTMRTFYPRWHGSSPLQQTAVYHALAVLPATLVLTGLGGWQFVMLDAPAWSEYQVLILMALSQVFGLLLFARTSHMLFNAAKHRRYPWRRLFDRQARAWCALFALLALLVPFINGLGIGSAEVMRYAFMALVVWAAFVARPLWVYLATAASALAVVALAPDYPAHQEPALGWIFDQTVLLLLLASVGFLVAALMQQRRTQERALRRAASTCPVTGRLNEAGLIAWLQQPALEPQALLGVEASNLGQIEDRFDFSLARTIERDISVTLGRLVPCGTQIGRMKEGFFVLGLPAAVDAQALGAAIGQALDGKRYAVAGNSTRLRLALGHLPAGLDAAPEHRLALLVQAAAAGAAQVGATTLRLQRADLEQLLHQRRQQIERLDHLRELLRQPHSADGSGLWLACQPVHRANETREEVGAEVLLRWQLPDGSALSPAEFLPLAERHGLAAALDRWVLQQAAAQVQPLAHSRHKHWKLSLNLSGASVSEPTLFNDIEAAIRLSGLPPKQWCFELTETAGIAQREQAVQLFQRLRELGASTALDDFGTGFATFDYLKALQVDYLKIDGSFLRQIEINRADQQIVRSIVEVARTMRLSTVAEFVERDTQRHLMAAYGVDIVQGYGVARPRPLLAHVLQLCMPEPAAGANSG